MRTRRKGRWLPKQPRLGARMCQGTFFLQKKWMCRRMQTGCGRAFDQGKGQGKKKKHRGIIRLISGEICDTLFVSGRGEGDNGTGGEKICANAAAKETFLKWSLVYEADGKLDYKEVLKAADTAAKEAGIASYTADLLIYLLMTAHLKERYQEKGISEQIWLDSCMDLNWKPHECRKMYGIWGSFVSWWFDGFFEMTRFALGRLQFELDGFRKL